MAIVLDGTTGITTPDLTDTSLTSGRVVYAGASGNLTGSTALTFDGTNLSTTNNVSVPNTFGFKNRIINGDMRIDQRNAGASYTQVNGQFSLDRWSGNSFDGGAATNKFSVIQSTTAPTGFSNSLLVTSLAATASGASNIFNIEQKIEGFNFADFAYGTANAQTLTLSFWVRSSLTGTFGGALKNSARNKAYPFTYTISSVNTFEQKTITITGDTSGTWVGGTNGVGLWISFGLGVGTSFTEPSGSWVGGDQFSADGCVSVVGTNGATWYISGVQLEKGNIATSFDVRPYATEFTLCQRYFQTLAVSTGSAAYISGFVADSASTGFGVAFLPVPMRTAPSLAITLSGGTTKYRVNAGTVNDNSNTDPVIGQATTTSFRLNFNSGFTTLVANTSGWVNNRDSTGGYFGVTAEL